jgi:hypothetical protein
MATAPYPALADVMNDSRIVVDDCIINVGGQVLTNSADYVPILVNLAYRKLQQFLISLGWVRFVTQNTILPNVPQVANTDTSLNVTLSWSGYNDGVNQYSTPALPQDLLKPLHLAARPSATAPNLAPFIDIDGPETGITRLPSVPKQDWNQFWIWDRDQINMNGANTQTDIRIDYLAFLANFATSPFPGSQTVPILNCEDALSGFIAYVFSSARGDLDAATLLQNAQDAARILAGVKPQGPPQPLQVGA